MTPDVQIRLHRLRVANQVPKNTTKSPVALVHLVLVQFGTEALDYAPGLLQAARGHVQVLQVDVLLPLSQVLRIR